MDNNIQNQSNAEKRLLPLVNYNFCLRVDGKYDLPCKSIHSFEYMNEFEYIREGGLNDYVHIRRKPVTKPHTFQVERYVGMENEDYLPNGRHLTRPILLYVNRNTSVMNKENKPCRTYAFIGCTVIGKSYSQLDAQQSGLATETITIAYQQLLCLDDREAE